MPTELCYVLKDLKYLEKKLAKKKEHGRRLLLYIQKAIQHDRDVFKKEATEYIVVKIRGKRDDVLLVSIYRSPNSDTDNNERVMALLEEISEYRSEHKVIVGDFNSPDIKWGNLQIR